MDRTLKVGIQGKGSASVDDLSILSTLVKKQTGMSMISVMEDNILLKMEWLKNGTIDFM